MKGIIIIIVIGIFVALSAVLWPYTINAWLVYFGKEATALWWHGVLLGFIPGIGQAIIPIAAFTWILMLFLV